MPNERPAILIAVTDPTVSSLAREWLHSEGFSIHLEPDRENATALVKNGGVDLVFFGMDDIEEEFRFYDEVKRLSPEMKMILLKNRDLNEYLPRMIERHYAGNLIARNDPIDRTDLVVTVKKLMGGDLFGTDHYVGNGKQRREFVLDNSKQKDQAIAFVCALAESVGMEERVRMKIAELLDELVTNAVFNAPVDARGFQKYRSVPRWEPVHLEEAETVRISCEWNDDTFALSVRDQFGSMNPMVTMLYLDRCIKLASAKYNQIASDSTGGGMGLFRVYSAVNCLVFNIRIRESSEVIALYDIKRRFREFKKWNKSIHFFVEGNIFDLV